MSFALAVLQRIDEYTLIVGQRAPVRNVDDMLERLQRLPTMPDEKLRLVAREIQPWAVDCFLHRDRGGDSKTLDKSGQKIDDRLGRAAGHGVNLHHEGVATSGATCPPRPIAAGVANRSCRWGVSLGQIAPARPGLEHPEDAVDDIAVARARTTALGRAAWPGEMRFDLRPLRVGHSHATSGHEHLRPV